jgi:hypothetical protein
MTQKSLFSDIEIGETGGSGDSSGKLFSDIKVGGGEETPGATKLIAGINALNSQFSQMKEEAGVQAPAVSASQRLKDLVTDYVLSPTPRSPIKPLLEEALPKLGPSPTQQVKRQVGGLLTGVESALEPLGAGIAQALTPEESALGQQVRRTHEQRQAEFRRAAEETPVAAGAGYVGGLLASGLAVPGGISGLGAKTAAGQMAAKAATGAAGGAAYTGTLFDATPEEVALGAAGGAAAPAVSGMLGRLGRKIFPRKGVGEEQAAEAIAEAAEARGLLTKAGKVAPEVTELAKKRGVALDPAEALKAAELETLPSGRVITAKQKSLAAAEEAIQQQKVIQNVDELTDSILPEGQLAAGKQASSLYQEVQRLPVSGDTMRALAQNPQYQTVAKQVQKLYPDLNPNSVEFNQQVAILAREKVRPLIKGGKGTLGNRYKDLSMEIKDSLGEQYPAFKEAEKLVERKKLHSALTIKLNKRKKLSKRTDLTPDQLKQILVGSEDDAKALYRAVNRAGGSAEQVDEVVELLEHVSSANLRKKIIGTATKVEDPNLLSAKGMWESITGKLGGAAKRDEAFFSLLNNPEWAGEIPRILQQKGTTPKLDQIIRLLQRARMAHQEEVE